MAKHNLDWREGSLDAVELTALAGLAKKANDLSSPPYGPIIEFGTLIGRTAHTLFFNAPTKGIITVDCFRWNPWGLSPESHYDLAWAMLGEMSMTGRLWLWRGHKQDFCDKFGRGEICENPCPPAMVFIDADHSYKSVKADIQWARTVNAGIICGHDYRSDGLHPGVKQAVDEFGGPKELTESLWVL